METQLIRAYNFIIISIIQFKAFLPPLETNKSFWHVLPFLKGLSCQHLIPLFVGSPHSPFHHPRLPLCSVFGTKHKYGFLSFRISIHVWLGIHLIFGPTLPPRSNHNSNLTVELCVYGCFDMKSRHDQAGGHRSACSLVSVLLSE